MSAYDGEVIINLSILRASSTRSNLLKDIMMLRTSRQYFVSLWNAVRSNTNLMDWVSKASDAFIEVVIITSLLLFEPIPSVVLDLPEFVEVKTVNQVAN